jgi:hypothetical protein
VPEGVWDQDPNQKSGAITLQAGQHYYIEAYEKEGGGDDHLEVAWSGPGISRQLIPSQYLSPTTTGCDGWCPNWIPPGHGVQDDVFSGFPGFVLTDIPQGTAATSSTVLTSFAAPVDVADNYGERMRAMLTAPVSGSYTFWVSSDDEGKLYLSENGDPSLEHMVANVVGWVPTAVFDQQANQQSAPINLVQGQQVYVDAYMKENQGGDHLEVAWSGPGFGRQIIPAAFVVPTTAGCAGWCPPS